MSASALICLAPGSEETEAVTTIDLMVRGGINVTTASVASDGNLTITWSRGVKILADAPLVQVADGDYDIIVLPGGLIVPGVNVVGCGAVVSIEFSIGLRHGSGLLSDSHALCDAELCAA